MKKIMILLAIAIVLFTACEPTAGGGGGQVLPDPVDETLYSGDIDVSSDWLVKHVVTVKNGVALERVYCVVRKELNNETGNYEDLYYFEVYTFSDEPSVYYIDVYNFKKQAQPFPERFFDGMHFSPPLTSFKEGGWFLRNESSSDGYYYYGLSNDYYKSEIDKFIAEGEVSATLTSSTDSTRDITIVAPTQFALALSKVFN